MKTWTQRNAISTWAAFAVAAVVWCGGSAATAPAATFSEPHTVFYGKVLGTGSVQDFLIGEGTLTWTIRRSDGQAVTMQTALYVFHDQHDTVYSYRLNVPHAALALGLGNDPHGIPMPPVSQVHVHESVTLDGETVVLLGPAGTAFTTEQLLRTSAYRLDLGIGRAAVDTDGDGIPDWWEDEYGLDKQDPSDAHLDLSGDGITALEAYLRRLDPTRDYRKPSLLTEEIIVYPSGSTAVLLDTFDLDSGPEQLVYTLTEPPSAGSLVLRNAVEDPEQPDAVLDEGDSFTQADLLKGRVVYDHDGSDVDPGFFRVSVRDENPDHPADERAVRLLAFRPAAYQPGVLSALEQQRIDNYIYAERGYVIMDAVSLPDDSALANPSAGLTAAVLDEYLLAYGDDRPYVFVAGAGSGMTVTGGHQSDVLIIGEGRGTVSGGEGADLFVFQSFESGRVVVDDFAPADGDVIDMSRLPVPPGSYVHQHLRLVEIGGGYELQTALNGGVFTNLAIALPGLTTAEADLYALVESDRLRVGDLRLEPRITVASTMPRAAQSGPTEGRFTLYRQGSLAGDLTVQIHLSGTAVNGQDYVLLPTAVTMLAGVTEKELVVTPYVTGAQLSKIARLEVTQAIGYRVGPAASASVTIDPLVMVVELELLEGLAVKDSGEDGLVLVRRRHVTSNDALIRLSYGGSAVRGTDYESGAAPTLITMAAGQQQAFITIKPRPSAVLGIEAKTVKVRVIDHEDYLIKPGAGSVQVSLIERLDTFAGWRAREFPEIEGSTADFAAADSGERGISHLKRYAFGLDPHDPGRAGLPRLFIHDGRLVVTFRKPFGVTDVEYRVTSTTNLLDWEGGALPMLPIPAPDGSADPEQVYYRADEDAGAAFSVIEVELK